MKIETFLKLDYKVNYFRQTTLIKLYQNLSKLHKKRVINITIYF